MSAPSFPMKAIAPFSSWTVADDIAFANLPEETKRLVERYIGTRGQEITLAPSLVRDIRSELSSAEHHLDEVRALLREASRIDA